MKYSIPITSDKWILKHADDIKMHFYFCRCTGEDCVASCPYACIGITDSDMALYPPQRYRDECTKVLLKHYTRLMSLEGHSKQEINKVKKNVKELKEAYISYMQTKNKVLGSSGR